MQLEGKFNFETLNKMHYPSTCGVERTKYDNVKDWKLQLYEVSSIQNP